VLDPIERAPRVDGTLAMNINWTITGDGLLAFAGGALALLGVWWSNHQSVKNLRKQFEAERNARTEEADKQKRAVAKVVLFEINNFYCYYVRDLQAFLKDKDVENCKLYGMKSISSNAFPIYRGNAVTVGVLEDGIVGSIVEFYSGAEVYLGTLRDYRTESERYYREGGDEVTEEKARAFPKQIKLAGPEITKSVYVLCEKLCKLANVEFRAPTIPVAGEKI
jgi:hypothetical protein